MMSYQLGGARGAPYSWMCGLSRSSKRTVRWETGFEIVSTGITHRYLRLMHRYLKLMCYLPLSLTSFVCSTNTRVATQCQHLLALDIHACEEQAQALLSRECMGGNMLTSWLCVDHNKLWKILKEMGIPDHLTCLLRNLYSTTDRTGHGTTDWFQIGKGVRQGCILSPCLFNLYAEYIMRNTWLEEAQAGIKIAGRNISNLRYADDTTLMAESEEEPKASWWKWKRRVKKLA